MLYKWAVVGAGPAGILAVGQLLDHGISAKEIAWIDPLFKVGDFGALWSEISSNTRAGVFLQTLHAIESFGFDECEKDFAISYVEKDKPCQLRLMAEALQWITDRFKSKVIAIQDHAEHLALHNRSWSITLNHSTIEAKQVILATGVEPKKLTYSVSQIIPLENAIVKSRLGQHLNPEDTIAVFGASHSAVLTLKNLVESQVKRIINFYREPPFYAVFPTDDDLPLFGNAGLLGVAAEWARENIDGKLPPNLERVFSNEKNVEKYLPECNKVIYAIGFQRRPKPIIEGIGEMKYVHQCGIIAPGLFGLGIAYPEVIYNSFGIAVHLSGVYKVMLFLKRIMPIWLDYSA